jgi:hypothetical protein
MKLGGHLALVLALGPACSSSGGVTRGATTGGAATSSGGSAGGSSGATTGLDEHDRRDNWRDDGPGNHGTCQAGGTCN